MTRTTLLSVLALALAAPAAAQEHIAKHAERMLTGRVYEMGLDQRHDFRERAIHRDTLLGEVDVRVVQHFNGVKVYGGEAIVHMAGGMIRATTSHLVRNLSLDTHPTLTATEALAVAHSALAPKGPYAYTPTAELVVAPVTREIEAPKGSRLVETRALAFHVHTELENGADETAHTDFFVDAHSGEILDQWSTLHNTAAKGTGKSQFSGTVVLDTNSTATGFEMRDLTRSTAGNVVYNLNHGTSGTGTIYTDADNAWGNGLNYTGSTTDTKGETGQTAAVDAAFGLSKTWDMYGNVFGRNGIDGNGTATYSRVHYSTSYDNAFWSDSCFCMTYGDGSSFKSLESLDVVGHEMSHGVMARTANLVYRGESGGLNEANSDIMGTMAEFYAYGAGGVGSTIPNTGGNFTIGEQLATPSFNKPLRFMYKPNLDGSSPNWWSKSLARLDVHYSNGPALLWFYLLSQGSGAKASSNNVVPPMTNSVTSITGIGNHKAAQIWFRAVTKYMTSSTIYSGARTATLNAASELFGASSVEYATVNKAWLAVNVK